MTSNDDEQLPELAEIGNGDELDKQCTSDVDVQKSKKSSEDDDDDVIDLGDDSDDESECLPSTSRNLQYDNELQRLVATQPKSARAILQCLMPGIEVPAGITDAQVWEFILEARRPPRRKLSNVSTFEHVVQLISESKNIIVLTGAGVSVSCGIPDFRSADGIYARLKLEYPDLPNPQAMFDIEYFKSHPQTFYNFAREIYPGNFKPSISHKFIAALEKSGKLLRNYTQNIDCLESAAGITKLVQCHGSFATAKCVSCAFQVKCDEIREDVENKRVPKCPKCCEGIMKPDIVFFGEDLTSTFHEKVAADKNECDLLIVIGSSLRVRPVSLIPGRISETVPQILVNREPNALTFDVCLYGDSDVILSHIARCVKTVVFDDVVDSSRQAMRQVDDLLGFETKREKVQEELKKRKFELEEAQLASQSKKIVKVAEKCEENGGDLVDTVKGQKSADATENNDVISEPPAKQPKIGDDARDDNINKVPNENDDIINISDSIDSDSCSSVKIDPVKLKLADFLPETDLENTYAFFPPSCYIFPGAELYECVTCNDRRDISDTSSSSDDDSDVMVVRDDFNDEDDISETENELHATETEPVLNGTPPVSNSKSPETCLVNDTIMAEDNKSDSK